MCDFSVGQLDPRTAPSALPITDPQQARPPICLRPQAPGHVPRTTWLRFFLSHSPLCLSLSPSFPCPCIMVTAAFSPKIHTHSFPPHSSPLVYVSSSSQVGESGAVGMGVMPGSVCCRCREPGHFQDQCHVMEVGAMVQLPGASQATHDRAGIYRLPVSVLGVHTMHWWTQAVNRPQFT